jgi:hypothetical protein
MARTAHLTATVMIEWQDYRGNDRECEVEVGYTYDGDDLNIGKCNYLGSVETIGDDELDELIYEAVADLADDAYAEWQAEYGEYLRDAAEDRKAA